MPEHFARRIDNVALLIEDEPDEALRAEEGLTAEETLLGLYRGIPLTGRGEFYSGVLPDTITLFRTPLYEEAALLEEEGRATGEEALRLAIRETLWHEIGHYFGLDDEHIHQREAAQTNHFGAQKGYTQGEAVEDQGLSGGATLSAGLRRPPAHRVIRLASRCMGKTLALIFGIIFVLVGLLGFVPNPLVGAGAIFDTNTAHDLVHLVLGIILLAVVFWAPARAALWLKIIGVLYLVVALMGFVMTSPLLGIVAINDADNWLHVVLGVVLFLAGWWSHDEMMKAPMQAPPAQPVA